MSLNDPVPWYPELVEYAVCKIKRGDDIWNYVYVYSVCLYSLLLSVQVTKLYLSTAMDSKNSMDLNVAGMNVVINNFHVTNYPFSFRPTSCSASK